MAVVLSPDVVVIASIIIVLGILGIVTNAVLIFYYVRRPIMRTSANVFFVHKAVADLLSLLPFPLHVVEMSMLENGWIFGDWVCKIFSSLETLCMIISAHIVFAMVYDCWAAVDKPNDYAQQRTVTKAHNHIKASWLYSLLLVLPMVAVGWTIPSPMATTMELADRRTCGYYWPSGEKYHTMYFGTLLVLLFFGHYFAYAFLFYKMWGRVKRAKNEFLARRDTVQRCTAIVIILVVNFVCYSVYWAQHVYVMAIMGGEQTMVPHVPSGLVDPLTVAATISLYVVAGLNLIIYGFSMDLWRDVVIDAVHCRCGRGAAARIHPSDDTGRAESAAIDVTTADEERLRRRSGEHDLPNNVNHQSGEDVEIRELAL